MFSLGFSLDSAIYGNASAGNPVETIPAPDFSFNYIDEIDTFSRVGAAGYSGSGDAAAFQREAAADVIRDTHDGDGILLEDSPTPWAGVAPTGLSVDPGEGQIDGATFTLPAVMTSVASLQYRFDSGSWVGFATASSLGAISVAAGSHTLSVRTVSTSGLFGAAVTSASFDVEEGDNPLLTNLVSYWTMDEASGTRNDSHGTNHLTDNNTVGSAAGKLGNAAVFVTANSESLSRANNAALQTGDIDYTLAGWFRIDVENSSQMIAARDEVGQREWAIDYASGVGLRFSINAFSIIANAGTLSFIGTPWFFVVCWHDATANTINIQVNNGSVVSESTGGTPQDATTSAIAFGARTYASFEGYLSGALDEWGFWKRVLTSDERTALYNSGVGITYTDF